MPPPQARGECPFSLQLQEVASHPWCPLAYSCISPISAFIFTGCLPCVPSISIFSSPFPPNSIWPHINLITTINAKTLFPNKVEFPGFKWTWIFEGGRSTQHTPMHSFLLLAQPVTVLGAPEPHAAGAKTLEPRCQLCNRVRELLLSCRSLAPLPAPKPNSLVFLPATPPHTRVRVRVELLNSVRQDQFFKVMIPAWYKLWISARCLGN